MSANEISKHEIISLVNQMSALSANMGCDGGFSVYFTDLEAVKPILNFDKLEDLVIIADILYQQNQKSLKARYSNFEMYPETFKKEDFTRSYSVDLPQLAQSINYYSYQSSQTDDYDTSFALHILHTVRKNIIQKLTSDYSGCEWGISVK